MEKEEFIKALKCLKCGSRDNLESYHHKEQFESRSGRLGIVKVQTVTKGLDVPICSECTQKFKKWVTMSIAFIFLMAAAIAGVFAFAVISYFLELGIENWFFFCFNNYCINIFSCFSSSDEVQ